MYSVKSNGTLTLFILLCWLQMLRADLQVRETRLREEMEAEV